MSAAPSAAAGASTDTAATHPLRFGYIIIPHPHGGVFKTIGKHHIVSYFPDPVASGLTDGSVICLWSAHFDPTDQLRAYLINPEKHALVHLGELSAQHASLVVTIGRSLASDPPTFIARDLLEFNQKMCILFIHFKGDFMPAVKEGEERCLKAAALSGMNSLVQHLEKSATPGDAVYSKHMGTWYQRTLNDLKTLGLIQDFTTTIRDIHKFDPAQGNILVPLAFARTWLTVAQEKVEKDTLYLSRIAKNGIN